MAPHGKKVTASSRAQVMQNLMNFDDGNTSKVAYHSAKFLKKQGLKKQQKPQRKRNQNLVEAREEEEDELRPKPSSKNKNKTNLQQGSKQPTVEDADTASEREQDPRPETRLVRKVSRAKKNQTREILQLLERAATALAEIGGAEEIEILFRAGGIEEEKRVDEIRKNCFSILGLLPESKSINNFSADEIPSTINLYDQSFIYRASSSLIYLLRPIDVFQGTKIYNRKKVFGYVREKGSNMVLMNALPGWLKCVEKHPRLLDGDLWTEVVRPLSDFHNHTFQTGQFDARHGRKKGDTYASHVEPRLMLWFAIDVLQKRTGKVGCPLEQRGDVWELRNIVRETIEAEIVLGRPPCPQCLEFQKFFERYTPIKFSFIVMKNLGEAKEKKNKQGQKSFSLFASEYSDSESDSEPQSRVQVVIRQKATVADPVERQRTQPSEVSLSTTMTSRNSGSRVSTQITTHLQQFYHTPQTNEPRRRRPRGYFNESDEEEYEPPSQSRSRVRNEDMIAPKTTRNGIRTPDSTPFGPDALERVQKLKQKRKAQSELENSPTSRKSRRSHY